MLIETETESEIRCQDQTLFEVQNGTAGTQWWGT